tara:strand:- start:776 stop:1201 length:426 start_codon:yes stop_codon:yes gene_type:complete
MKRTPFTSKPQKRMKRVTAKKVTKRASLEGLAGLHHMGWIKMQPCACCGAAGPSDAHHAYHDRFSSGRRSDWLTVPLCKLCHQDGPVSVHKAKAQWRERWGPDWLMAIRYLEQSPFVSDAPMAELLDSLPAGAKNGADVSF